MTTLTAPDVKRLLRLEPHPREGGFFRQTFADDDTLPPEVFASGRYDGPRRTLTSIYYLLESETFSEMHLLASDEIFHHYLGDPVEMLQLHQEGSDSHHVLGPDLLSGQTPQLIVRRNTWQGSRLLQTMRNKGTHGFALLGCTVAPGFEYADYRSGTRAELLTRWPAAAELIVALTHR